VRADTGAAGSQVDAAAAYLAYLEKDQRQPSLELLSRLAQALALEPDKLFLLAHPKEAPAFIRAKLEAEQARGKAWCAFLWNKPLLARHKVQPRELEVLAQANQLGRVTAPYDFLFILNSIRQAMDIPWPGRPITSAGGHYSSNESLVQRRD
jgi:transcriptional regulator with XRE-family HTH domain